MRDVLNRLLVPRTHLQLCWVKRAGWMADHLRPDIPRAPCKARIERVAGRTNRLGPQRLAQEYGERDGSRSPDEVRSSSASGDVCAWLVIQRRPAIVVEFGSAFGVSGMYFAAGLRRARHGHLYSFEINEEWADIAEANIRTVSDRVTLTRGSFEEHVDRIVPGPIDLALVDGIHTYDLVMRQFQLLADRVTPGGLLLFDDIDFHRRADARMRKAWEGIAAHPRVKAAVEIDGRLGLVEMDSGTPGQETIRPARAS